MKKVIVLAIMFFLLCGCKGGGGGGGGDTTSTPGSDSGTYADKSSSDVPDNYGPDNTMVNPEPSSMILLGIGLAGLATAAAKKRKK